MRYSIDCEMLVIKIGQRNIIINVCGKIFGHRGIKSVNY
jgi:hypothetical protein